MSALPPSGEAMRRRSCRRGGQQDSTGERPSGLTERYRRRAQRFAERREGVPASWNRIR
jgi:hypothetical protein